MTIHRSRLTLLLLFTILPACDEVEATRTLPAEPTEGDPVEAVEIESEAEALERARREIPAENFDKELERLRLEIDGVGGN